MPGPKLPVEVETKDNSLYARAEWRPRSDGFFYMDAFTRLSHTAIEHVMLTNSESMSWDDGKVVFRVPITQEQADRIASLGRGLVSMGCDLPPGAFQ